MNILLNKLLVNSVLITVLLFFISNPIFAQTNRLLEDEKNNIEIYESANKASLDELLDYIESKKPGTVVKVSLIKRK